MPFYIVHTYITLIKMHLNKQGYALRNKLDKKGRHTGHERSGTQGVVI